MQEVDLPASFTNVRCQGVRSHHTCMDKAPILDLPRLFLHSDCDPQLAAQTIPRPESSSSALHCKRTRDSAAEDAPAAGTFMEDSQPNKTQAKPGNSLNQHPQPSRAAQNAVCEYMGMLACGLVPVHAMQSEFGTSIDGEMNVWSWEGLMGGSTVTHAVQACMDKVLGGKWPWACVLLHGLCQSPFSWKGKDAVDEELQKVLRVGGRRSGHVDGAAGESVGAVLLLPGKHACLIAMSGAGDNFCKF